MVAVRLAVSVLVMAWTATGAPPPVGPQRVARLVLGDRLDEGGSRPGKQVGAVHPLATGDRPAKGPGLVVEHLVGQLVLAPDPSHAALGGPGEAGITGQGAHSLHRDRGQGDPVSYTHLRAHETDSYLVCRLL